MSDCELLVFGSDMASKHMYVISSQTKVGTFGNIVEIRCGHF